MSDERAIAAMYDALAEKGWAHWAEGEDITLRQGMEIALAALRADGFEVYRPEELTRVGWCPRGDGHADIPEPDDPNDFGICGTKWTHTALMTPWVPVEDQ